VPVVSVENRKALVAAIDTLAANAEISRDWRDARPKADVYLVTVGDFEAVLVAAQRVRLANAAEGGGDKLVPARGVKVFGWLTAAPETAARKLSDLGVPIHHLNQVRAIVAAKSQAEVARIVGEPHPRRLFNLTETGNETECQVALARPGIVLYAAQQGPLAHDYVTDEVTP
jgi:hypothetical protein